MKEKQQHAKKGSKERTKGRKEGREKYGKKENYKTEDPSWP